jgi:hypothetical protein
MDHDRTRDADDGLIEEEVVVVREGDVPPDREDILEGVIPDHTHEPQSNARPDFARGQEERALRLEGMVEDRFSRGQEADPTLHEQVHEGDFATGQAEDPRHPETTLEGRYARGQQLTDPDSPNEDSPDGARDATHRDAPARPDR